MARSYEIKHQGLKIVKQELQSLMDAAHIPGVSIAFVDNSQSIYTMEIGVEKKDAKSEISERHSENKISPETIFGAASLSKPVFAYLVLKLIENNNTGKTSGIGEFKLPYEVKEFNLDTPLYKVFPDMLKKFSNEDKDKGMQLTARMVLTHTTGLPITHHSTGPIAFQFEPGEHYGYSGPGIACLQETIEALTGASLEMLAKEHVFTPLDMKNSSFQLDKNKLPQAANSLHTTPSDYVKFIKAWMDNTNLQYAFTPSFSMKNAFSPKDWPIKDSAVPDVDREHVAWGLGFGLQIDDEGNAISAYHSGDMSEWRAWVAMNLKEKSAIVYFSNSHNGHILAEHIIPPEIKLDHVFNFFFKTYGFARDLNELTKEDGDEFKNGLRKGCLSGNLSEEKKSSKAASSTAKIAGGLSDIPLNPTPESLAVNALVETKKSKPPPKKSEEHIQSENDSPNASPKRRF